MSVDYRLAVGGVHYPVPLDDCVAATRWVRDNAAELGVDPARITVGGASAGATWPPAAALRLRDEDGWAGRAVPGLPGDAPELPAPSPDGRAARRGAAGAAVQPEGVAGITANYLGGQPADGYSFPPWPSSAARPTLLVNAEYDDLRTTGEAFVEPLAPAGVDVHHVQADSMLHGFLNLSSSLRPVDAVLDLMAERTRAATPVHLKNP